MQHETILKFFAQFIEQELGIIYSDFNYFQLNNRLEEICKLLGVSSIENLYSQAQQGITGSFKQLLLDTATNNETSFFRDPRVFKAMENEIFPQIFKNRCSKKIRIWSAASSTGQEALSSAMLIQEYAKNCNQNCPFEVIATDISNRALDKARSGKYSQLEVQRGLPTPLMLKYFQKNEGDQWQANSDLLRNISFRSLNLKDNFSFPEKFDLILCRNVLIYQNVQGKIDILKKITNCLDANGYLILGSGESLLGLSDDYTQVSVESVILYKKKQSLSLAA